MRMPLVAGDVGIVALLKSMRDVDDLIALISKGFSSFSPGMEVPPYYLPSIIGSRAVWRQPLLPARAAAAVWPAARHITTP
jgi:hypothetical protein